MNGFAQTEIFFCQHNSKKETKTYQNISKASHLEGKARGRATTLSFTLSTPEYVPTYDVYQNDLWSMRRHALQKFQNAGNTVVVRLRCGQRLDYQQLVYVHCSTMVFYV